MANKLKHLVTTMRNRSMRLWLFLELLIVAARRAVRTDASAHVGTQALGRMQPYQLEVELATNNFAREGNVCLAGAPLFEGRWIPDTGEIITAQ